MDWLDLPADVTILQFKDQEARVNTLAHLRRVTDKAKI